MASKTVAGMVALALSVTLVAACSSSGKNKVSSSPTTVAAQNIDYKKLGLWNDGPCDPSKPPLKLGLMTVFESPVISLKDQADALQASAKALTHAVAPTVRAFRSQRVTTKRRPIRRSRACAPSTAPALSQR